MPLYLTKVLSLLALPLAWALLLALAALTLAALGRQRLSGWMIAVQVALLWLLGMPWTATRLTAWLEAPFPPVALEQTPMADALILLGGAVGPVGDPPVENLSGASSRVLRAARLFRAGKVGQILASGGNQPWLAGSVPEAELMRDLLVEWGVPPAAIVTESASRTTRENALLASEIVRAERWQRVLLVTSASHMARAVGAFGAVGIDVIPSPTDYGVGEAPSLDLLDFVPNAGALAQSSDVIHELIGGWFYCWQGWSDASCI